MKLRFLLLAVLLSVPAFAGQDWTPQPIGPFGGINNRDNSFTIPANMAQDALNVNVTNQGKSVKKRPGYSYAIPLVFTTSSVHGVYYFYNSVGNDVILAFNDVYATMSIPSVGTGLTVFSAGITKGSTWQCSDYLGSAYCVDSSRDGLFKAIGLASGVSFNTIPITSTGTMVAACPTRLAMAGFSGVPAEIDFSADTDFTTWGTGSLGTSPVQLTVTSPGSRITHITYAFGRLMWFKETSFGYVLIGNQPLQTDWVIKTISNTVGTLDNSSTQDFNGNLYFRGQDGHIYVFDGANVVKLSREIAGTVAQAQTRTPNSWTQTSQSDFQAGSLTNLDSTTTVGSLQLQLSGGSYLTPGTYLSAVKNAPNLTSWDSITATKIDNTFGSHTFSIRASTNSFTVSSATPSWTTLTIGSVPTISTGTFLQIRDVLATTNVSSTPVLSDFTVNWFEGSATDKAYAAFFDDKVWFSVPIGAGQSTNNRILIYDLLYQGWTLYDLPSNGFYIRNNALYFGSSNGGYVYKYGVGNNDAGSAINAYWKSKDFFGADPFTTQEIANISLAANSVANSNLTVTYTLNGSTSTAYTMGLGSGTGFVNKNKNLPAGVLGSEFNVQFGNNAADQPFEVFGVQVGIRERPWIPN